jgi:hypothetical protein
VLPCLADGVSPVHSLADDLDVRLGMKKLANIAADAFVVIHHEHTKGASIHRISYSHFDIAAPLGGDPLHYLDSPQEQVVASIRLTPNY